MNITTYAPNLDKLLNTFDWYCGLTLEESSSKDDYLEVLLDSKALIPQEGMLACGSDWSFMLLQGEQRRLAFQSWLSNLSEGKELMNVIGAGGLTADALVNAASFQKETTLTLLSWMESLDMVHLQDGLYYPNLTYDMSSDEEFAQQKEFYDVEIDIKDDKYSIFEYLRKINRGQVILNPDFQRNLVWKPKQKSKFIESILMNLPIPPIYLKKESGGKYIVVDGLQRTTALMEFVNNDYALDGLEALSKLNGCRFKDLDIVQDGLAARLEDRQLYFYVMLPSVPMYVVYDVFNRINTGGTQLTRQEIRNCVFPGPATALLKEIAASEDFVRAVDRGIQPLRMKDREAVLRCLAYIVSPDYKKEYTGSLDDFLEKAMRTLNKMNPTEMESLKKSAIACFNLTYSVFGNRNFRIPTDYTRGRINIAVMETVFHCFYGVDNVSEAAVLTLQTAMDELLNDDQYYSAVVASTGSISQVMTRFEIAHHTFDRLLKNDK